MMRTSQQERAAATMKLQKWLESEGMSQADLARVIGCNKSQISRWLAGECLPPHKRVIAIQKLTKNAVSPEDWYKQARAKGAGHG